MLGTSLPLAMALWPPTLLCLGFPCKGRESLKTWGVSACFAFGKSPNSIQLVHCPSSSLSLLLPPTARGGHRKAMSPIDLSRVRRNPHSDQRQGIAMALSIPSSLLRGWVTTAPIVPASPLVTITLVLLV